MSESFTLPLGNTRQQVWKSLLFLLLLLSPLAGWGQNSVPLYNENFGSGTATPAGWTVVNWSVVSTGSSDYAGASGGSQYRNSSAASTNIIEYSGNLSTVGYSNITVLWGARRTTTQAPVAFSWSSDGTTWNPVIFAEVANNGTWALVNGGARIPLPASAAGVNNLRFRWVVTPNNTSTALGYRLDDFSVSGALGSKVYTWTGGNGNWSSPTNWTPARSTATVSDILVFDPAAGTPSAVSVNVDFSVSEIIAQLRFLNGVNVSLASAGVSRTLTVSGNLPGSEFEIAGSSNVGSAASVEFVGLGGGNLKVIVPTGNQGRIGGNLSFSQGQHELKTTDPASVEFTAGSLFRAAVNFSGNAFGETGTTNSVIFRSGATYTQEEAAASPFGNSNSSIASFENGSRFVLNSSSQPSLSNRTYGTLEFAPITASNNPISTGTLTILNDLVITSGTVRIGAATVNIGGNLTVNNGNVTFIGGPASVVRFNGTSTQAVNGSGGADPIFEGGLEIANPAGLTLSRPVRTGGLSLTNGTITTTNASLLTLVPSATVTGGSSSSYVNGPFAREVNATGRVVFPIGKGGNYRPLALDITNSPVGTTTYTAEQIEGAPADQTLLGDIKRISRIRYYSVTPSPVPAVGTFAGTIELSYGTDDDVTDPRAASFVVAKSNGSGWASISRVAAGTNSVLVSGSFDSFSNFILASTDLAVNPLPVELRSFTASGGATGIQLHWVTASEKNNAAFEMQRGATANKFETIGWVEGQGTSSQGHRYEWLDARPLAGVSYYRLRQLDHDGTEAFSPVVVVQNQEGLTNAVFPNPTTGVVTLPASLGAVHYRVLNNLGQTMLSGETIGGNTMDMQSLREGTYFLEVNSSAGRSVQRVVKSR
ncbi:T9SS type A sorting domain-containing protein [Hymenobacter tibetensis]|uniref:T9SS type A sorting domain-containing protein n=1 Tax=Hymenobacter tibetensis TaxID=497967 RepID=A0ABY4D0N4_9BACT|nr:T9SS type A sorting domain-containing protein [Hymenobacter tibetensis]UOG73508.1 T9SS type A sorting domain-containing protein [Hymenobacter tibetensis]